MGNVLKSLLIILIIGSSLHAKVSPSEVFEEAKAIKIALAKEVVQTKGVSLLPVIDIDLKGATPSSVYALGSALNFKLMIIAKNQNKPWKTAVFPHKKITPKEVKELLLVVQDNLTHLFDNVTFEKQTVQGKKPSDVALQLTYANQWLDKIMPFVKPQYPLAILEKTQMYLNRVLQNHNIPTSNINAQLRSKIKPKDVFVNITASYNLLRNLKRVHANESSAVHPYNILSATSNIKPLDVYSLSVFNLFYLYSLGSEFKTHSANNSHLLNLKTQVKPNTVFQEADKVNYTIAQVIAQIGVAK